MEISAKHIWKIDEFAKLINVDGKQVVVMMEYDSDDERDMLVTITQIDGTQLKARAGFKRTIDRDSAFHKYNEDNAREFINGLKEMLS